MLGVSLFGQNEKQRLSVVWSADANCHPQNAADARALGPRCSSADVEGTVYYIITAAGISYAMTYHAARGFSIASVQISNKTDQQVDINPFKSRAVRFASADEFFRGAKGKAFSALSHDDLRKTSYRDHEVAAEPEGGIRPGLRVEERYEDTISRSGRVVSRTTVLEPKAPPTENPLPKRTDTNLLVSRAIFDNLLSAKIVPPRQKVAGHLVFKNSGEEGFVAFVLPAGQLNFVFPLAAPTDDH
jgi:hypothetical protein